MTLVKKIKEFQIFSSHLPFLVFVSVCLLYLQTYLWVVKKLVLSIATYFK